MNKIIRTYINFNNETNKHYYKDFEERIDIPEIGNFNNGPIIIKINKIEPDCENNKNRFDYNYYEIISKYEEDEDIKDNYYYEYIAIKKE